MALLSDVFAATPEEAAAVDPRAWDAKWFPAVQAKYVDAPKLAALEHLLGGSGASGSVLFVADDGSVGLEAVRADLTTRLAELPAERIPELARDWGATEEWGVEREDLPLFTAFVGELVALARQARSDAKELFLWWSL